ncbi:uncharacterized protein LOC111329354 [Stylophora pistillata]|uniref:Uncharacterized protein n=1 Tax=Stylophora pistillata TaxID=50429 RepID=A0A2B4SAW0_STYPI|nr:uncharacterized protein LOC111329354 [Stylophora pistillata]PFX26163.1 hypothetical protein AWC38_SpisGene9153 [Stylophora pistillata]
MEKSVLFLITLGIVTAFYPQQAYSASETAKSTFRFLLNFYRRPVVKIIKNSTAHEDIQKQSIDEAELKRDEIPEPTIAATFSTATINFPINRYMANVMFQLFGKDGILEKGGFDRNGYIRTDASASIVLLGGFGNRSELLHEVLKAHDTPINAGAITLVVQLFFSPDDFNRLTNWLREEIRAGYENFDDPCSPIVCIKFVCCTKIANPILGPKFGTIRVGID